MLFFRDAQGGIIIKVIKVKLNKTRTKKKQKKKKESRYFKTRREQHGLYLDFNSRSLFFSKSQFFTVINSSSDGLVEEEASIWRVGYGLLHIDRAWGLYYRNIGASFLVSTERAQRAEVRYFTSTAEDARSISSLLYDQKSCECSVKTQQGVEMVRHHRSCETQTKMAGIFQSLKYLPFS